jgi:predicted enzyme related to lactoylglutathione lyase
MHGDLAFLRIPVFDLPRALAFYTAIGLEPLAPDRLRLGPVEVRLFVGEPSTAGLLLILPVPDVEAAVKRAETAGGRRIGGMRAGVWEVQDTEGGRVGFTRQ